MDLAERVPVGNIGSALKVANCYYLLLFAKNLRVSLVQEDLLTDTTFTHIRLDGHWTVPFMKYTPLCTTLGSRLTLLSF
jgi:hypothetical protein